MSHLNSKDPRYTSADRKKYCQSRSKKGEASLLKLKLKLF